MLILIPSLFIDSRVRDPCLSDPQLHLPLLVLQSFRIETVRIEADERIKIQSVGFGFDKALTSYHLMIPALSTDSPFQDGSSHPRIVPRIIDCQSYRNEHRRLRRHTGFLKSLPIGPARACSTPSHA